MSVALHAVDPLGPDTESVTFELDQLQRDGERGLVVRGRWSGIRGRRFVRPTLTMRIDGTSHRLLADLEHKPWAAEEGEDWVASFSPPPPAGKVELIELSVAPDITVSLSGSGPRRSSAPVQRSPSAPAPAPAPAVASAPAPASASAPAPGPAVASASAPVGASAGPSPNARRSPRRKADTASSRSALQEERAKAEDLSRRLEDATAAHARLIAERDELRVERDALLVERDGMRRQHARARKRVSELQRELKALEASAKASLSEARDSLEAERAETGRLRGALQAGEAAAGERDRLARQLDTLAEERNRMAAQAGAARLEALAAPRRVPRRAMSRPRGQVWAVRAAALTALGTVLVTLALVLHLL